MSWQRASASGAIVFGASISSGVCAWVQRMSGSATAFIRQPVKGKFHHASFELRSWEQVLRAGDILSRTKTSIDIGPTRHGITRGTTRARPG